VPTLGVIIITKNEQHNISECLASISWANEIVVVDAGSTDTTVAEVEKVTKKVFVRPWEGYGSAKNFALSQTSTEWILWLDADERVTPELKEEIFSTLQNSSSEISAYSMPRKANFLGRWIMHCGWYPGRVTRLFRKDAARFTEAKVHERLEVNGRILELHSDLLHYTDPNLHHYLDKFNKYTSLASEELVAQNQSFSIVQITLRPLWVFFRMYILKLGMLDGIQGFLLCVLSSCYVFTKYAKLWERNNTNRQGI
jgi:glycosyltransferase involved in cell wall biosynthesis